MKKSEKLTKTQIKIVREVLQKLYELEDQTGYQERPLGKAINWLQREL